MGKLIVPSRRGFLTGLAAVIAAPAIVRYSSLMPIKSLGPVGDELNLQPGDAVIFERYDAWSFRDATTAMMRVPAFLPRQQYFVNMLNASKFELVVR